MQELGVTRINKSNLTLEERFLELDAFYDRNKDEHSELFLVGDFNRAPRFWAKHSRFGRELAYAISERTFPSFFPFFKLLQIFSENVVCGAVDNIYYKGAELVSTKVISSRSDHKIVFAEFKKAETYAEASE